MVARLCILSLVYGKDFSYSFSELILTFLLLFVHLKFLRNTWLNKIPMVFAGITTVFIGGIDHIALCGLSTFMGISMAVLTEIIIVFLAATNKEKQVKQ